MPSSKYLTCQGYDIHFTEWGAEDAEPIVMWHGLARNGRDFDPCAEFFADRYRCICPDTLGRGWSQWANDDLHYGLDMYARIAVDLVDQLRLDKLRWVGTSMGGALGIKLAAGPLKGRITHLVLNDFGPEPAATSVERIIEYVGNPASYETIEDMERDMRVIYAPFGFQTDAQWRRMAETSARRKDDGMLTAHYDPRMIQQLVNYPTDYLMWDAYDQVDAPTLLLRGADSDLVKPELAQEMKIRGPKAEVHEIPGCGHAPALNVPEQLSVIDAFLSRAC